MLTLALRGVFSTDLGLFRFSGANAHFGCPNSVVCPDTKSHIGLFLSIVQLTFLLLIFCVQAAFGDSGTVGHSGAADFRLFSGKETPRLVRTSAGIFDSRKAFAQNTISSNDLPVSNRREAGGLRKDRVWIRVPRSLGEQTGSGETAGAETVSSKNGEEGVRVKGDTSRKNISKNASFDTQHVDKKERHREAGQPERTLVNREKGKKNQVVISDGVQSARGGSQQQQKKRLSKPVPPGRLEDHRRRQHRDKSVASSRRVPFQTGSIGKSRISVESSSKSSFTRPRVASSNIQKRMRQEGKHRSRRSARGSVEQETYSKNEILEAGRGFFGSLTRGLAGVIERAFENSGRPNGYILGEDASGAFFAGLRYGEGYLHTRDAGTHKVYWQGPSFGYDFGAEGSKVMVLVYNIRSPSDIYHRFGGVEGSAYLVGGASLQYQRYDNVVMAPIRTGVGVRLGANIGYLKYTRRPTWNPF